MALNDLMNNFKRGQDSLIRTIDTHLMKSQLEDNIRANITNSPSSSLGCVRRNFYQRSGEEKDKHQARTQRIFDNGDGTHDRIQRYLKEDGILVMDEVPLINDPMEIMGHTDGLLQVRGKMNHMRVLEIKSINSRGFSGLKQPKDDHVAQGHTYMYCLEERRLELQRKHPTPELFASSKLARRKYFERKYAFILDRYPDKPEKAERKHKEKVKEALRADSYLYNITHPINEVIFLYECKDTQEMKEFLVKRDDSLMSEVLYKFELSNQAWEDQVMPERECKTKAEGRFCPYLDICFPR